MSMSTEVGGRNCVGQKVEETAKGKSLRGTSLCMWVGKTCSDRETGGEATGSREQLGSESM